jgi:hypothetical protein
MAQQRSIAVGQNCRKPSTLKAQVRMPNGVNPAMQRLQTPIRESPPDSGRLKSKREQLVPRHHPSLSSRKLREPPFPNLPHPQPPNKGCLTLWCHMDL